MSLSVCLPPANGDRSMVAWVGGWLGWGWARMMVGSESHTVHISVHTHISRLPKPAPIPPGSLRGGSWDEVGLCGVFPREEPKVGPAANVDRFVRRREARLCMYIRSTEYGGGVGGVETVGGWRK